jgi:[ribosomal protein S5]-alanine N-acetyltransferase
MSAFIREHIPDDFEEYFDWQSDAAVGTYVSWLPRSREEIEVSFHDALSQQSCAGRKRYFFAVVDEASGAMVGDVGFTVVEPGVGDCGWFIRREQWGNGFGREAAIQMIEFAFEKAGLDRLIASCSRQNYPSQAILRKCGFVEISHSQSRSHWELSRIVWKQRNSV